MRGTNPDKKASIGTKTIFLTYVQSTNTTDGSFIQIVKDFILRLQLHIGIYLTAWAPDAGSLKTDTEQSGASVEGLEWKLQRESMAKMAPCVVGSAHHHHLPNPRPLLASSHLLVTQTNT